MITDPQRGVDQLEIGRGNKSGRRKVPNQAKALASLKVFGVPVGFSISPSDGGRQRSQTESPISGSQRNEQAPWVARPREEHFWCARAPGSGFSREAEKLRLREEMWTQEGWCRAPGNGGIQQVS